MVVTKRVRGEVVGLCEDSYKNRRNFFFRFFPLQSKSENSAGKPSNRGTCGMKKSPTRCRLRTQDFWQ